MNKLTPNHLEGERGNEENNRINYRGECLLLSAICATSNIICATTLNVLGQNLPPLDESTQKPSTKSTDTPNRREGEWTDEGGEEEWILTSAIIAAALDVALPRPNMVTSN